MRKWSYRLINNQKLMEAVMNFSHSACGISLNVHEDLTFRKGVSKKEDGPVLPFLQKKKNLLRPSHRLVS